MSSEESVEVINSTESISAACSSDIDVGVGVGDGAASGVTVLCEDADDGKSSPIHQIL